MNLIDILCSDPVGGPVYRHLFNGGSWFEADQMHWRIQWDSSLKRIESLVSAKPTQTNQQAAKSALSNLEYSANQLVPNTDPLATFKKVQDIVVKWAPPSRPPLPPKVKSTLRNTFGVLVDDEDDE
jgi:hypothetical protein